MPKEFVIVPCYNEASRLRASEFLKLANRDSVKIFFVDDGSTDGTDRKILDLVRSAPKEKIELVSLPQNVGKAEAVRHGLLRAIEENAEVVGYADADLSTPVSEIERLLEIIGKRNVQVVLGSGIKLLGNTIERKLSRHLLGRVFATVASLVLELGVYDTQCGAKFFRVNDKLQKALSVPFLSRWAFDVELIGRLLTECEYSKEDFLEVPLLEWQDVGGSKLKLKSSIKAGIDLLRIGHRLRSNKHSHK